jgi:hypothetical protein
VNQTGEELFTSANDGKDCWKDATRNAARR